MHGSCLLSHNELGICTAGLAFPEQPLLSTFVITDDGACLTVMQCQVIDTTTAVLLSVPTA